MSEPPTVVTWYWPAPNVPRKPGIEPTVFTPSHVNTLASMLRRHLPDARFVCVTDEPAGINCETMPCPPETATHAKLAAPRGVRFPSSYRRLWNFSAEAKDAFGPRILALDIDVIITGDLRPLVDRSEDFVTWWDCTHKWGKVPGGIYLHRTGTLTHLWTEFNPAKSPATVANSRSASPCGTELIRGSDQGWLSYRLLAPHNWTTGPHPLPHWTRDDGVWSNKWLGPSSQKPPRGCRIISTPGEHKPWTKSLQRKHPWILKHWRA